MNITNLLENIISAEESAREHLFLAPCVSGGKVCLRIDQLIHTVQPGSTDFEGWGIFRYVKGERAELAEEAFLFQVDGWMQLFPKTRLYLVEHLSGKTWLAVPFNGDDAIRRFGRAGAVPVHLVEDASPMEVVTARWDGSMMWFETLDRACDPQQAHRLRAALEAHCKPDHLRISGLTPEARAAYKLAFESRRERLLREQLATAEGRLRLALERAGGSLVNANDRGAHWIVHWRTSFGENFRSVIDKRDLTVISAGICLDGQDRRLDLQSLVGVTERRPEWV
jgi:hypothetical protein